MTSVELGPSRDNSRDDQCRIRSIQRGLDTPKKCLVAGFAQRPHVEHQGPYEAQQDGQDDDEDQEGLQQGEGESLSLTR